MLLREFKINFKTLFLYTVILSLVFVVIFILYPSIVTDETKIMLNKMVTAMPKEMTSSFNMDIIAMDDAYGWFKTEGYLFLILIGSTYASILGATILIKEENDKTIDFLNSKPVSRKQILASKVLCGVINIFIFTFVVTIFNLIFLNASETFVLKEFLMISYPVLLTFYLFFFTSLLISTFLRKTKASMSIGIAIVFLSYAMQIIGGITEDVKFLKEISYFEFSSARYIVLNNAFDTKYIIAGIATILIFLLITHYRYDKKEFI